MKFQSVFVLLIVSLVGFSSTQLSEEYIEDYAFDSSNATELEQVVEDDEDYGLEPENEVDLSEDLDQITDEGEVVVPSSPLLKMREQLVKSQLLQSMRSAQMRDQVAKVLPILRVMSPDQKLALATLVTTQMLAPADQQLTLDQVCLSFLI